MSKQVENDTLLHLYKTMLKLRMFEDKVSAMYKTGEIPGFVHCYQGEEAIATGVCAHLCKTDVITSTHRGHGHVIAKGCPTWEMMAELYGKSGGCSGGRGGSMHAYNMDYGLLGTNGMVGGGIGLAIGAGYAQKYKKTGNVAVCFFGDGASNMGIFYESMNIASKWNLPVIFVCENNLYATATSLKEVAANPEIATRARVFDMPGIPVDGNDILDVYQIAGEAIGRARNGDGPTLIEAKTYRTHGHHEGDQIYGTYRTKEELENWKTRCPIETFRNRLIHDFNIDESILDEFASELKMEMDAAVEFARQSPIPAPEGVHNHIYSEV